MIPPKKRFEVLKRDGFRCQYCGKTGKDVTLEVDHIIPQSKWGTDEFNNLITCCRECNMWKGNEELESPNSIFNVKCKDLYAHIKSEFYRIWNEEVKSHELYNNRKLDGTLDVKTMGLIASFLQRWLDERTKNIKKVKEIIQEDLEVFKNVGEMKVEWESGWYLSWGEWYVSNHPLLKELSKNPSLMEQRVKEFFEWGAFFDEVVWEYDWDFIANDCAFNTVFYDERRKTNSLNDRLNYQITANINEFKGVPSRIIKKYSLFPNAKM